MYLLLSLYSNPVEKGSLYGYQSDAMANKNGLVLLDYIECSVVERWNDDVVYVNVNVCDHSGIYQIICELAIELEVNIQGGRKETWLSWD